MTSWKTTLAGALSAVGIGLTQSSIPLLHTIGVILAPIGAALVGLFASDHPAA